MLNQLPRAIIKLVAATVFVTVISLGALAQTPSPTPVNPATLPPGTPTTPPTAPPGTVITPVQQPTPITPALQEPTPPNFPDVQPQPLPPMPDLSRVGIISSNSVPLSMTDAIRKALQNNNDIEVARDDVRFAEQQLIGLQGVYEPIFSITPQLIKNITPQQSSLGGSGGPGKT